MKKMPNGTVISYWSVPLEKEQIKLIKAQAAREDKTMAFYLYELFNKLFEKGILPFFLIAILGLCSCQIARGGFDDDTDKVYVNHYEGFITSSDSSALTYQYYIEAVGDNNFYAVYTANSNAFCIDVTNASIFKPILIASNLRNGIREFVGIYKTVSTNETVSIDVDYFAVTIDALPKNMISVSWDRFDDEGIAFRISSYYNSGLEADSLLVSESPADIEKADYFNISLYVKEQDFTVRKVTTE